MTWLAALIAMAAYLNKFRFIPWFIPWFSDRFRLPDNSPLRALPCLPAGPCPDLAKYNGINSLFY
jgi:hypothetical protein